MKDLLLHIGRHKSGTTAIQRFLKHNGSYLSEHDFYYPETGIRGVAHHLISEPMQKTGKLKRALKRPNELAIVKSLMEETEGAQAQHIILSSEAFQNCTPTTVAAAFPDYRVRIIVYIRNQLDYLTSAYAQKVHATNYSGSLEDYFKSIFSVDYFAFLNSWRNQFPEKFTARKFSRPALVDGDVVSDFICHGLEQSASDLSGMIFDEEANPSLNAKVVELKLHLNRSGYYHKDSRKYLYYLLPRMNDAFPASKVRASEKIKRKLLKKCLKSDTAAAEYYFSEAELFDYSDYQSAEAQALNQEQLAEMLGWLDQQLQQSGRSLDQLRCSGR